MEGLVEFGKQHRREILSVGEQVIDIALAERLGCAPGSRWMHVGTLRHDEGVANGPPICATDNYIDLAHAEVVDALKSSPRTLVATLIEERYNRPTVKVSQSARAVTAPDSVADLLRIARGSPTLEIVRHYVDALNDDFIITRTFHPGDRYALRSDLLRE